MNDKTTDVTLTRGTRAPHQRGQTAAPDAGGSKQALLPHERDQHPDAQAAPQAPNHEVGEQAFLDVSHGLVDTDEALRSSTVAKRRATPPQPSGELTPPRQATVRPK